MLKDGEAVMGLKIYEKEAMNVQTPKNKINKSSFMTNTKYAKNEHKL